MARFSVEDGLRKKGYITEEQLLEARAILKSPDSQGKKMEEILIEYKFVTEEQLLEITALRSGYSIINLKDYK